MFHYILAQYLHLHGQPEAAGRYWKRCMDWHGMIATYRTLAGAALIEQDM